MLAISISNTAAIVMPMFFIGLIIVCVLAPEDW